MTRSRDRGAPRGIPPENDEGGELADELLEPVELPERHALSILTGGLGHIRLDPTIPVAAQPAETDAGTDSS